MMNMAGAVTVVLQLLFVVQAVQEAVAISAHEDVNVNIDVASSLRSIPIHIPYNLRGVLAPPSQGQVQQVQLQVPEPNKQYDISIRSSPSLLTEWTPMSSGYHHHHQLQHQQQERQHQQRRRGIRAKQTSASTSASFDQCLAETNSILYSGDLPPTPHLTLGEWQTYCPNFPTSTNGNTTQTENVDCDFSNNKPTNQFRSACQDAGGKILRTTIDLCSVDVYIRESEDGTDAGTPDNGYTIHIQRIRLRNVPQCGGTHCTIQDMERIANAQNKLYGVTCPTENPFAKFALRIKEGDNENDNGSVVVLTKSCQWLRMKDRKSIGQMCRNKKYQLYPLIVNSAGVETRLLPASRVCPDTCASFNFDCVYERGNARFISGTEVDEETNATVVQTRQCGFLSKKKKRGYALFNACYQIENGPVYMDVDRERDMKYGYGWEVCTESCPSACRAT